MLTHYDRSQFEVACYHNSSVQDDITEKFRAGVDLWRSVYGKQDDVLAEEIRADQIDILIDLSGHTAGNRLFVFARKPAPLQVSAWGYPTGTGLEAMDYLFTYEVCIPRVEHDYYRERIAYLPCAISFMPLHRAPPIGPLPASASGRITFGCFNNPAKISDEALSSWAKLLNAVDGATLLFKAPPFSHLEHRERVADKLAAAGVESERISFKGGTPWSDHISAHNDVDIMLDPFPYCGGISTMESLWMGVPVVTLHGRVPIGRMSAGILNVLGMSDWVAQTSEDYWQIAQAKCEAVVELAKLRGGLRERLNASALMDPQIYVRAVETAYRTMWREWCAARLKMR